MAGKRSRFLNTYGHAARRAESRPLRAPAAGDGDLGGHPGHRRAGPRPAGAGDGDGRRHARARLPGSETRASADARRDDLRRGGHRGRARPSHGGRHRRGGGARGERGPRGARPPAVAIGLYRELRATQEVRLEAVAGVLCLYVLVGMTFGFIYGAIDNLGGDPFFANDQAATVAHCLYFSLTTLATVGYGDFVARSNLGHTLSVSEAMIGQIYLVTVVSLIVSNLRRPNHPERVLR